MLNLILIILFLPLIIYALIVVGTIGVMLFPLLLTCAVFIGLYMICPSPIVFCSLLIALAFYGEYTEKKKPTDKTKK